MVSRTVNIRPGFNKGVSIGAGAMARDLGSVIDRAGAGRVVLLSTPSVESSPLLAAVVEALGPRHVATFARSRAHTPRDAVAEAAAVAQEARADALVSLGGSSVVDMAKGVAMILAEGDDFDAMTIESGSRLTAPKVPHIAIPTTLSAAEFTSAAGITNPATGVKELFVAASLAPHWVILDPLMTSATPPRLWAGTGMKLVADCLEGLLSSRSTQFSVALLQGAYAILVNDLGAQADDTEARGRCLEAAHMTLSNLHNVGIGAVGALRHQIGGRCGVAHGEASTIVLPHVMRWNGASAEPALVPLAHHVGLATTEALISSLETQTEALGLPRRLSQVGVREEQLDAIAEHAAAEGSARTNVRPADASGLREILDAAF